MDSKSIFTSKVFWGTVISAIAMAVPKLGITSGSPQIDQYSQDAVELVGAAIAIYGRFKATQPVHLIAPSDPNAPKP